MQCRFSISRFILTCLSATALCSLVQAAELSERGDISAKPTDNGARIVFNWSSKSKVAFKPEAHNNKVYLHFEEPVSLDWNDALNNLSPYLKQVETINGCRTVVLTMSTPSQARKFLMYSRNGVDFSKNGLELTAARNRAPVTTMQEPQEEETLAQALPPVKPQHPARKKLTVRKESKKDKQLARSDASPPSSDKKHDTASLALLSPAAGQNEPATTHADPAVSSSAAEPHPAPAAAPSSAAPELPTASTPAPVITNTTASAPVAAASSEPKPTPAPHTDAAPPVAEPKEIIALPLLKDDAFSVFVKDKTLWIAAEDGAHLTAEGLKKQNPALTYPVKLIPAKQGSVLAVTLGKEVHAAVEQLPDGKLNLTLSSSESKPGHPLIPSLATDNAKTSLTLETPKAGKLITVTDPATGNTISILPTSSMAQAVGTQRNFVEFSLLPTAQGVVIQHVSDTVSVEQNKDTLSVSTPSGLAVSPDLKQQIEEAKTAAEAEQAPPVLFPYSAWKLDDGKKFVPTQVKLFHLMLSPSMEDANNARLKLLQLYLAEGLFAEANGMANDILRNSYKFYTEHKVAAMRGAANFFRGRYAEAKEDFSAPELEGMPETKMWLSLAEYQQKKDAILATSGPAASYDFKSNYENFLRYYPPSFIQKIAIIAADRNIALKDYDGTTAIFTALQKDNLDEPIKKYIDFTRAKILTETGNDDEAAKIWERQAADINDRFIRARAEFALINMYLKEEKMPIEDAARRLEKLRIVWRGDELELNVLTLLGNLYVEQKNYARALRAWRDIVAYYSDKPEAISTAQRMEEVFVKLYNKNAADNLPPLAALSLFYEFRDLVPTGADGDLMIRNLAERLVKIDLLDRASQLLNHQIRNRLQGTERSRVGARLAEIYLMNRQPKQALETLKTTGYGELPPDVQLNRIRLTAQALAQQGQLDKAIDVLSSDTSAEGNLLRLTVYWTNWDWPNVVAMAEEILSNRNDPSAPLTLPESEVLLKLATAYVYEHDSGQIQYLRDYFTPLLKGNPNKDSFLFITSESGSIDYSNLSNLDKDIQTVKGFISNSRKSGNEAASKAKTDAATPVASAGEAPKKNVN